MDAEIKPRILVVDDVTVNRRLLRGILNREGYEVDECDSGEACLLYCQKSRPGMILLDVVMEGLDGNETCRTLRSQYSREQLPIIMVTNRTEGKDVALGLQAGANDYVTKPVDRVILLARVNSQLATSANERKLREQKEIVERTLAMQNAMSNVLPDAVAVHGEDGRLLYGNRVLTRYCGGFSPGSIDDVMSFVFGGLLREDLVAWHGAISQDSSQKFEQEFEVRSGDFHYVRVISKPFLVGNQKSLRLWVWRDMTAIRELEKQASQRVKLETVGLFASGVAHNFNNIFSVILSASELLGRQCYQNERAMRCVGMVKRAVESGCGFTRKLSVLVKRETDSPANSGFSLPDLIRHVVEIQSIKCGDRIKFEVDIDSELKQPLMSVKNMHDVINNLVANAVESIDQEGMVLVVARNGNNDAGVELRVKDSGSGMTSQAKERLYEPFFSTKGVDAVNGVSFKGRGLGLWNVYNLLGVVGGTIDIDSQLGIGTEVLVRLPIQKEANSITEVKIPF